MKITVCGAPCESGRAQRRDHYAENLASRWISRYRPDPRMAQALLALLLLPLLLTKAGEV